MSTCLRVVDTRRYPMGADKVTNCNLIIQPAGGLTANYCDDSTDNYQVFVVSGITSGCTLNTLASFCDALGGSNVTVDESSGKTGWNPTIGVCNVYYKASGTSGRRRGTIQRQSSCTLLTRLRWLQVL